MSWVDRVRRPLDFMPAVGLSVGVLAVAVFFLALTGGVRLTFVDAAYLGIAGWLLAGAVLLAILVAVYHERLPAALRLSIVALACSAAVTVALAALVRWNDGSGDGVFALRDAWLWFVSFGLSDPQAGPVVLVRFLPLGSAIALAGYGLLRRLPWRRILLAAVLGYVILAAWLLAPSLWIAAAAPAHFSIRTSSDASEVFVRLESNGFWTQGQVTRFFGDPGAQAANAQALLEAALAVFGLVGLLLIAAARRLTSFVEFWKSLLTRDVGIIAAASLIALIAGWSFRPPRLAFSDVLSVGLFTIVVIAWLVAWTMRQALVDAEFARGPMAGGRISIKEAGIASQVSLVVSLLAASLVGWPAFLGVSVAWISLPLGESLGLGAAWSAAFALAFAAAGLGLAGVQTAARDLLPLSAMLRVVVMDAVLVFGAGVESMFRPRPLRAGLMLAVVLFLAGLAGGQTVWFAAGVILAVLCLAISRSAVAWARLAPWIIPGFLAFVAMVLIFLPGWVHVG